MLRGRHGERMARKEQFYTLDKGSLDEREDRFWLLTGDDGRETIEHEYSYHGPPGRHRSDYHEVGAFLDGDAPPAAKKRGLYWRNEEFDAPRP
jgi:hypothetical protein